MEFDEEREREKIESMLCEMLMRSPENMRRTALRRLLIWADANMMMRAMLDAVEQQFGAVPLGSLSGPELTGIHRELEGRGSAR